MKPFILERLTRALVQRSGRLPEVVRAEILEIEREIGPLPDFNAEQLGEFEEALLRMQVPIAELLEARPRPFVERRRVAQAAIRAKFEKAPRGKSLPVREAFWRLGCYWYSRSFAHMDGRSDRDWEDGITSYLDTLSPAMRDQEQSLLYSFPIGMHCFFSSRWIDQQAPVVQFSSHKYAAHLAMKPIDPEVVIESPWKAWLLELPHNLLECTNMDGEPDTISHIIVHADHLRRVSADKAETYDGWSMSLIGRDDVALNLEHRSLAEIRKGVTLNMGIDAFNEAPEENWLYKKFDPQDIRCITLGIRMVLGVCVAMSDPAKVKSRSVRKAINRRSKKPEVSVHVVGEDVADDRLDDVRQFIHG